jgi:hypothetical protein
MLFTRVRIKYKGKTLDCTNFFSLSATNQDSYHNTKGNDQTVLLVHLFRSALFGVDQMSFDTLTGSEKIHLALAWYKRSELIVLNKEEDNIVY